MKSRNRVVLGAIVVSGFVAIPAGAASCGALNDTRGTTNEAFDRYGQVLDLTTAGDRLDRVLPGSSELIPSVKLDDDFRDARRGAWDAACDYAPRR